MHVCTRMYILYVPICTFVHMYCIASFCDFFRVSKRFEASEPIAQEVKPLENSQRPQSFFGAVPVDG